jgi:hypothetical protein
MASAIKRLGTTGWHNARSRVEGSQQRRFNGDPRDKQGAMN